MTVTSNELLRQICACEEIGRALQDPEHPCRQIVDVQTDRSVAERQVPEPWSGHIAVAPVLFVSSNPSLSKVEWYPRGEWSDDRLEDFFEHRFGGGRRQWIRGGSKTLGPRGTYSGSVRFLASMRARASELLGAPARPGLDYCLTEVVHCKSTRERGVASARSLCAQRWLDAVMRAAGARVIVVLGRVAEGEVRARYRLPAGDVAGPMELAGRRRFVAFLPHPNAFRPKTFRILPDTEVQAMRAAALAGRPA